MGLKNTGNCITRYGFLAHDRMSVMSLCNCDLSVVIFIVIIVVVGIICGHSS